MWTNANKRFKFFFSFLSACPLLFVSRPHPSLFRHSQTHKKWMGKNSKNKYILANYNEIKLSTVCSKQTNKFGQDVSIDARDSGHTLQNQGNWEIQWNMTWKVNLKAVCLSLNFLEFNSTKLCKIHCKHILKSDFVEHCGLFVHMNGLIWNIFIRHTMGKLFRRALD